MRRIGRDLGEMAELQIDWFIIFSWLSSELFVMQGENGKSLLNTNAHVIGVVNYVYSCITIR